VERVPNLAILSFSVVIFFILALETFQLDHSYVIFNYLWPSQSFLLKAVLFIIRFLYLLPLGYFIYIAIVGVVLCVAFQLFIASHGFYHLNVWCDFCVTMSRKKNFSISQILVLLSKSKLPSFGQLIKIHTQAKIMETIANKAYFYFLPSLLLFGGLLLVFANYGTIKMQNIIPMPFFLIMPMLSIVITNVVMYLFPAASEVHQTSCDFLRKMKIMLFSHKYWVRKVNAERPFRFNFGSLFIAKKSTQTRFMLCVFDTTIDSLLIDI